METIVNEENVKSSVEDVMTYFPFPVVRKFQEEIIRNVLEYFTNKNKKYCVLEAPTGIGKSAIAYTLASYFKSSYILVSQKILQDQYINDFKKTNLGIATVKGKYNYFCLKNPVLKCDNGVCSRRKSKTFKCDNCPYYTARDIAYASPITVLNYSYFFNMSRASGEGIKPIQLPRQFLVLDEAHNAENELLNFMTVCFDRGDFKEKELGHVFSFPLEGIPEEQKFEWLRKDALPKLIDLYTYEFDIFKDMNEKDKGFYNQSRKCSYLDTLICMINRMFEEYDYGTPGVVMQSKDYRISFKLLYGRRCSKYYLFNWANKCLMMSATIIDKDQFYKDMGINPDEAFFIKCPSLFPKENRPIYKLNVASLSYKKKEQNKPKIVEAVKTLLDKHSKERGIVHTVSFDIADAITSQILSDRFIVPKGKKRDEMLTYFFKSSRDNLVLVSPSLSEGIDLKDDFSRFCIVTKVPYGNLGDEWVKRRFKYDPMWYQVMTLRTLIQMTGRSVRSETDKAVTYILDSDFNAFFAKNLKRIPSWWLESVQIKDLKDI